MSKAANKPPTYAEVIEAILHPLESTIPVDDLIDQVQAMRPSKAKKPRQAILNKIREEDGRLLVRPEPAVVMPLRLAYQGVRFRIPLDREKINRGLLEVETILATYLPFQFPIEQIQFVDSTGRSIPFQFKPVTQQIDTIFGLEEMTTLHVDIKQWFRTQKMYHKDHILVTLEDWEEGIFRLEREVASARDSELLEQRDRLLADILFELLEKATYETIYQHSAIPTAYAILPDKNGYPPNHWIIIIENDERMAYDGWQIGYSDGRLSPIELMVRQASGGRVSAPTQTFSRKEAQQVYRFKAALKYNTKIWRVIEIQGKQTLADLDRALRLAFNHDTSDHLGGFWKMIRRGGRKRARYREVDVGTVNPFEGGEGADTPVAGLGLQADDRLKYVYDFGDWIEHLLTLQAIDSSEKGQEYPREIARNRPRYVNCVTCQEKGETTVALYICLTCSNRESREIVLCTDCADRHDEDHYLEEILY